jgi:tetratricopeptide (TPR) repeat protein
MTFHYPLLAQADDALRRGEPMREALKTGLTVLYVLLLIPVLVALFFVGRFIYRIKKDQEKTTIKEDHVAEAERYAAEGEFLLAAKIYDTKLKEYNKAAVLYEKGGEYLRAAALYDVMRMAGKAKEMYLLGGDIKSAAELTFLAGEYEEASRLYYDAGMKKDAAMVFERADRKLAAVRIYRELGEFERAAGLLEEEGLHKEAAEMYGFHLKGRELDSSSVNDFYRYAVMLQEAGETEGAGSILQKIYLFDPAYRDVGERIQSSTPDEDDESMKGKTTLKGFIRSGKLEPRHALKLWVQILRGLSGAHETGLPFGVISTDNILIDSENNISFLNRKTASVYDPPERTKGLELDIRSDIFSMGCVLYEMLTGKLEGLGSRRVTDVVSDVPEWLDEIVVRCIRKVRDDRYRDLDEIFDHLKTLSREKD